MARKKTTQQFIMDMEKINPSIEIISEYLGCKEKVRCKCKIDGYEWEATPKKLFEGRGCPLCGGTLKLTNEQFVSKLKEVNPNIISLDSYINSRTKIRFQCKICGHIWNQNPNHVLHQGTGCPNCKHNKITKPKQQFIEELGKINQNITLLGDYVNSYTKTSFQCKTCGNIWEATPKHILYDYQGCPRCAQSKGEKQVESFLLGGKIDYIPQYKLNSEFFSQNTIKVDFYIPSKNTIIEYNGKQHYVPVDFGDKDLQKVDEKFQKQVLRDTQLRDYCKINKIKLIEIPYTVPLKEVNDYLKQRLQ